MTEDDYDLLGVGSDADTEDIKRAFRRIAAESHPDASDATNAGEQFKRIQRAKEVLTDEQARRTQLSRCGRSRSGCDQVGDTHVPLEQSSVETEGGYKWTGE